MGMELCAAIVDVKDMYVSQWPPEDSCTVREWLIEEYKKYNRQRVVYVDS